MALSNPGRTIRMAYRFCELATFDMALLFAMAHCVSAPTFEQRYQRTRLSGNEVLLSVVGSIGEVAVVPANFIGWNVARAIAVIRAIETVSPQWLRLCLSSEPAQHFMHTWKTTTVQETLNLRDIRRLPILFPPTHERQAITTLLTALDDKIAANDRITETCDHLRSLSLQSWMQGNPAGSEERPLSSLAEFVNGRAFTKNASGTGRMVIRIAELNSGPALSTVYNDIAVPDQHLARPGDVLFAWSGSLTVTRWFRSEGIINQHIFKVLPTAGVPSWLIFSSSARSSLPFGASLPTKRPPWVTFSGTTWMSLSHFRLVTMSPSWMPSFSRSGGERWRRSKNPSHSPNSETRCCRV